MALATVTVLPKSVAFNGATYDSTNGGPSEASFTYGGREITEYSGDAFYGQTFVVDGVCNASCTLKDLKQIISPGTKGMLTFIVTGKSGADSSKTDTTITMTNMVFVGSGPATQPRAAAGSTQLRWAHDSQDGTTGPVG